MALSSGIAFFHVIAIVVGTLAFFISVKNRTDAEHWNQCAPTLRVNHCPQQAPEDTFHCQNARMQMDTFLSSFVQGIRRKDERQDFAFYTLMAICIMSIVGYILYFFLSYNGQLCLGKCLNFSAILLYALVIYWTIMSMIAYNSRMGPYGGRICSLGSTTPLQDFGDPLLKKCFEDFHLCQDAILILAGIGIEGLAVICHFLAFFSAVWDCQTQIDPEDWGTIDDMPDEEVIIRPPPPVYEILNEEEQKEREEKEKMRDKLEKEHMKEVEKRRKIEQHERMKELKKQMAIERKIKEERDRILQQEENERRKEEKRIQREEEKRRKEEEHKRRLQLRKERDEEERREREQKRRQKEERRRQLMEEKMAMK